MAEAPEVNETLTTSDAVPKISGPEVQQMILKLNERFQSPRNTIKECVEVQLINVNEVAALLSSLSPEVDNDHHKIFLESHLGVFAIAVNLSELFGTMNFHWSYLDPSLLDHLVRELDLNDQVKEKMEAYKLDLQKFRRETPLTLFCMTQKQKKIKLSPVFQAMVAEFEWENDTTLEVVEQFRQEYISHYSLRECAMTIAQIRRGCFIITWFVPESVIKKLKANVPREILKKYLVTKLEIAGVCVYNCSHRPQEGTLAASVITTISKFLVPKYVLDPFILFRAVSYGDYDGVELLLSKGINPNDSPSMVEFTPLMEAGRVGNEAIACLLLDHEADPNKANYEGQTPLMVAASNGQCGFVDILLERDGDPNRQNHTRWSALMAAVLGRHKNIAMRLIEAGANPHLQDKNLTSALLLAISTNQQEVVDALLDCTESLSQLDTQDSEGETALIIACKKGSLKVVRQLLAMGANKHVHNNYGQSPDLIARELGDELILQELCSSNTNSNVDPRMS